MEVGGGDLVCGGSECGSAGKCGVVVCGCGGEGEQRSSVTAYAVFFLVFFF